MEKFIVSGGNRLYGKTRLKGAKNSILPLLAGALLTREKVTIRDCPDISDVAYMCEIIKSLGADVVRAGDEITISGGAKNGDVPENLAHEIRSSVFLMGSLVATLGRARIAYPGGCDIGLRPVDIHIRALKELNIKIDEQSGYINCATDGIVGADVGLDKISVGATENIMMAAVLGKGTTIIRNAAKEPEITDLQNMLNKMGADITVHGDVAVVRGVRKLYGAEVHASDLRGGSALVLAGLKAEGVTSISGVGFIDRGYESFEKTLSSLGAKIQRISVND